MQFNEHQKGLPSPTRVTYIHQVSESCLYKTKPRPRRQVYWRTKNIAVGHRVGSVLTNATIVTMYPFKMYI